ncbi:helix-turn-helix transcriptional regulator [Streptomyces sp. Z26]|uniref:helix-turn-helix domain-containing protein n=1 Tax=Streptomyces sp. Z26 TaxID=2500177 RepID=UPI000EF13F83|nr:helix-turn-helix transcriptional regulator [Streptomyces sp. Z26]RLL69853.1 XRE family transcriptional regulator [Streptomyces sp. Z26]
MGATDFARRLGELKERSGLSYGQLAKRLHLSTSTLHRYVNGTAVPVEFAAVERLARACGAKPDEVVELHRLWILADATRGRTVAGGRDADVAEDDAEDGAGAPAAPEPVTPLPAKPEPVTTEVTTTESVGRKPHTSAAASTDAEADAVGTVVGPVAAPAPAVPVRPSRRRLASLATGAAAAVCAVAVVVGATMWGGGDDDGRSGAGPEATAGAGGGDRADPSGDRDRKEAKAAQGDGAGRPDDTARDGDADPDPGTGEDAPGADDPPSDGGTPVTARVRPYAYENPCAQHFLVDRSPSELPQPPDESEAPSWVRAFGAVPAGEQLVEVTLQGTGRQTVVLERARVRVVGTRAPLAWNEYATGIGCGGGVSTSSFTVDLDAGQPLVTPKNGQRDFPYKVSESDPEVFLIKAGVAAKDVTWYLELEWSSGGRHGVLRVDDQGKPFRTSGASGRPEYRWPLGADGWSEAPRE